MTANTNADLDISRHRELINTETFNTPVTIIGAGATGSFVAFFLAKLGVKTITVYDFDKVEGHNVANQLFGINDIGKYKVDALAERILNDTGIEINTKNEKVTNQKLFGYVFMMVDTMSSRKEIYENSVKMKPSVKLLIEPRMGLDIGRIFNVEPVNVLHNKSYVETLYGDDVAELSACGSTMSVITTSSAVASMCVRQLINDNNKIPLDNEINIDFVFNNLFADKWVEEEIKL